ncbi:MobF family relaxase, partial [Nonomuraea rhodomycinica]
MLSMSTGYDPGYLTATAAGAENYYLSASGGEHGEPPGRWTGAGCAKLGLVGNVDPDVMKAIYAHLEDPRDPSGKSTLGKAPRRYKSAEELLAAKLANEPEATPERIKALTLEASDASRSAVLFHDATFSPAKSVSLMHAGYQAAAAKARAAGDLATAERMDGYAEQVWAAVRAGSAAAMEYLQEEAGYSRTGYHGAIPRDPVTGRKLADHSTGQFVEAKEWVIASFDQHTSRNGDPQLHIHNAILNRVECPDGEWRTIDSRAMRKARPAAAAIAERVMEEQLTRDFGVKFATRPDGKAREIVGISQEQRDLYSSRRA